MKLNGLKPEDVVVEMLFYLQARKERLSESERYRLEFTGNVNPAGEHIFSLQLKPDLCGKVEYRIRAYPCTRRLLILTRWG